MNDHQPAPDLQAALGENLDRLRINAMFLGLDARNGELFWKTNLGGTIASGPITYQANGRQYVAVCADNALYAFGLPE